MRAISDVNVTKPKEITAIIGMIRKAVINNAINSINTSEQN